ncbi:hypothetical protein LAZ67_16001694 [Cordylochernes scorpioides]|uniref:Uncharacterized protein n=1 Tax=Cordylochernes scorpioides TaxID=51811 RepID=A0ABY6LBE2_9ARAC|nr:hypothetical protein LAZ67_16001694 [Cordylochernes scorpioides]
MKKKLDPEVYRFALSTLSDSLVTGARRILLDHGVIRWIHGLLWVCCFAFMTYQTAVYISIYLTYPVTLTVGVEYPESVEMPAITICTGHRLITNPRHMQSPNIWHSTFRSIPLIDKQGHRTMCRVFNQQVDNPNLTFVPKIDLKSDHAFSEQFKINYFGHLTLIPNMMFPKFTPALFTFHSPLILSNPYQEDSLENLFFEIRIIKFRMTEVRKIPAPYTTNCLDYMSEYKRNGKGPVSKPMCIQECAYKTIKKSCGCFLVGTLYFSEERFCEKEDMECVDMTDISKCDNECKDDCRSVQYTHSLQILNAERVAMDRNASGFANLKQQFSSISEAKIKEGIFVGPQIRELQQDSNFQNSLNEVEAAAWNSFRKSLNLYSTIGGYVSIWLGLSILEILEFFLGAYQIFMKWLMVRRRPTNAVVLFRE